MRRGTFHPQQAKQLLQHARSMRREPAPAEKKLWSRLRGGQLDGFRFRRQHPIAGFIVDFYCPAIALIVELDGDSHFEPGAEDEDASRTEQIERTNAKVLRAEVFEQIDAVLAAILTECHLRRARCDSGNPSPPPSPLSGERE